MLLFASVLLLGCDNSNDPPPNPGHVKVFVTSLNYNGNRSGLAAADADCTTAATGAGQTGTWTAWLSDSTANAADRINNGGGGPYQLINGTVIANNMADLLDSTLDASILIDESGNNVVGSFEVWTGTAGDGTYAGKGTCTNWSTADPATKGLIGQAEQVDVRWSDVAFQDTCSTFNRLYCFADANSF